MQPIIFKESPMTLAEFESINKKFGREFFKMIFSPGFVVLLVIIFVAYKYLLSDNTTGPFDLLGTLQSLAITALIIGFSFGLIKYLVDRGLKNAYHANPELMEGLAYTLTQDSIVIEGKSNTHKKLDLSSFEQATLINNWLVISAEHGRYYLDFERLVPPATVAEVGEVFQRNGIAIV